MSDAELIEKCKAWLRKMLETRLHRPEEIGDNEIQKAATLLHGYIKKKGPLNPEVHGFSDGILLSLIVFNTTPDNVKGMYDEVH